jgi:hypothetical protein
VASAPGDVAVAARKAFVILDGTLLPIDRIEADRPFSSGKHRKHFAGPGGRGPRHQGSRSHGLFDPLNTGGTQCWADMGYQGSSPVVRVPFRGHWDKPSAGSKAVNRGHAKIRALGEQALATLKSWRLLRKLGCGTTPITDLVKAVLTLEPAAST